LVTGGKFPSWFPTGDLENLLLVVEVAVYGPFHRVDDLVDGGEPKVVVLLVLLLDLVKLEGGLLDVEILLLIQVLGPLLFFGERGLLDPFV